MKLLTSLSWLTVFVALVWAGANSKRYMLKFDQKTFPTLAINLTSPSAVYCAVLCKTFKMCTYYSYNVADKLCLIHSKPESSMTLVTNVKWQIYEPECSDFTCYNCGFETDARCMFEDSSQDDFDWTRHSGTTLSKDTGPPNAAEGSYYLYTEATGIVPGDKAVLTTETASLTASSFCLSFQYHMMGEPGSLKVFAGDKSSSLTSIWEKTGVQLDPEQWKKATVDIPQFSNPVIAIEGTRGPSFRSDIAIDDLALNVGACKIFMENICSSGFPNSYDIDLNMTWRIEVRNGNIAALPFSYFDLEEDCDYVKVFGGDDILLGECTGTDLSPEVRSTNGFIVLMMTTESSVSEVGFSVDVYKISL